MQLSDGFDLADNVLFAQQLEKPIIPLFLDDLHSADVLHVGVDSDPEHRVVVQFLPKDVLRLGREVFELKFVHFELLDVLVKHQLGSLVRGDVLFTLPRDSPAESVPPIERLSTVWTGSPRLRLVERCLRKEVQVFLAVLSPAHAALEGDVG